MDPQSLSPVELYHACDAADIPFATTEEITEPTAVLGQDRALEAIGLGMGMRGEGYNLYLAGSTGLGKRATVEQVIAPRAAQAPPPRDWCYVNNFQDPHNPRALSLPPGRGHELRAGMERLVKDLLHAIPVAFQSEEYRTRAQEITHEFEEREEHAFAELGAQAQARGLALMPTPGGYTLAPMRKGKPMDSEDFDKLSEEEKARIQHSIEELKEALRRTIRLLPQWNRESAERFEVLNNEFAAMAVEPCLDGLRRQMSDLPEVVAYLEAVKQDVILRQDDFMPVETKHGKGPAKGEGSRDFHRYEVNLLVDHRDTQGAPIIYEDSPTFQNLVGRIEHLVHLGTLVTNFTLIKPGALHRANGGYLLLDAHKVLINYFAWEALKRALRAREIRVDSLDQFLSLASTVSLQPQSIPLNVKVVLLGDRLLYYLLCEYDPEFGLLFKVTADFSESFERTPATTSAYAHLIASLGRKEGLRPIDRLGVARIIEQSSRLVEDGQRFSLHLGALTDLMREADYWAGVQGAVLVEAGHVQRAIEARIRRSDQVRERLHDEILRGTILIDTQGERIAQVNGLSVLQLADFAFGQPSRITATARPGEGEVVDIEREVELGWAIHSKGVLILTAYLGAVYAQEFPLSLSASLVFEQTYGGVDGDSASAAELCALLSALSGLPIKQGLAVTGAVNQHGVIQAIGGVNEKIEGFFDICQARGLTGDQGAIIPRANVKHLMLRRDLVEAAAAGRFHVYAVDHVDQMMELLTGVPTGEADAEGLYPEGSMHALVYHRLQAYSRLHQHYDKGDRGGWGQDDEDEPDSAAADA